MVEGYLANARTFPAISSLKSPDLTSGIDNQEDVAAWLEQIIPKACTVYVLRS